MNFKNLIKGCINLKTLAEHTNLHQIKIFKRFNNVVALSQNKLKCQNKSSAKLFSVTTVEINMLFFKYETF